MSNQISASKQTSGKDVTSTSKKLIVATLLYPDFELMDVFGPLEMFGMSRFINQGLDLKFVSQTGDVVASSAGPKSVCDYSFSDFETCDILMVPGGLGSRQEVNNKELIDWVQAQSERATYVVSVCTGAAILAQADVLTNHCATTNKIAFDWVQGFSASTNWHKKARWVKSDNIYTSSGVSAGTDMSLAILEHLYGREHAEKVAHLTEYVWNHDPDNDGFAI
ncbi:DJ-1/PfpI family protein [Vibrio aquimaris]|uniref:Isonitrile hydratase n=1 Tax=Vibrio aquimaris TaxID=2587862 RepID=A0A5P9CRV6_9VIBR|nr:DJ-1/PfpI family protein [Vibrio aquimaris]QFT28402.1 Isonitrile hydratase [Vibrio aquimaris]